MGFTIFLCWNLNRGFLALAGDTYIVPPAPCTYQVPNVPVYFIVPPAPANTQIPKR